MSRTDGRRIAILGAGPVGLEAALYAASLKLPFRVYDRGRVGENVRCWGHVRLFSPFSMNSTPLGRTVLRRDNPRHPLPGDSELLTGREYVAAYLEPLAECSLLAGHIETSTTVVAIGRKGSLKEDLAGDFRRAQHPFRLLLRDGKGHERAEEADIVLDCTGTYGNGRFLGDGGIPAVGELAARAHIACGLEDIHGEKREQYADRTVLVVGSGHSAATTVCLLAGLAQKQPSTWVIWLARGAGSQPIRRVVNDPLRERDAVAGQANRLATRGEGHIEFHPGAVVEVLEHQGKEGFLVRARIAGSVREWTVDRVIANVGCEPDHRLYRELQVHECPATLAPGGLGGGEYPGVQPPSFATLRNPEPNFFVLGMKSFGRSPHFLLRTGFEQVRVAFTLITGRPDLDLHRSR